MRRLIVVSALVAAALASAAVASRGDPEDDPNPADMARAKSMVLKQSDLAPGFKAEPAGKDNDPYCKALDESALTRTGKAVSPDFVDVPVFIASGAEIYASVHDANVSWRQGTSPAGERCVRVGVANGGALPPMRRISFPRLAAKTIAYRIAEDVLGGRLTVDFVVLQEGRAQASLIFASGGDTPVERATEISLSKVVAARVKRAMRTE